VQIPSCFHTEASPQGAVQRAWKHLGEVLRELTRKKESRIEEGRLMPDYAHMMISIPLKYAVSQVVGFIKGKRAIHLAMAYGERKQKFCGPALLGARLLRVHRRAGTSRSFVSTSGTRKRKTNDWTR
jgi:putative transposase